MERLAATPSEPTEFASGSPRRSPRAVAPDPQTHRPASHLVAVGLALVVACLSAARWWQQPRWNAEVPTESTGFVVDVNRDGASTLRLLPGIGPELASRVVDDRAVNGPFASPADLQRVSRIGPLTVARIEPFVTTASQAVVEGEDERGGRR